MNTEKTLLKKIASWLASHLFLIGLIIFGIGLFLSSCGKAKAENMITYSDLDNYFNSIAYHDSTFDAYYEQAKAECPYFYTAEFTWQGSKWIQIFFSEYDGMSYSTFQMYSNSAYFSYGGEFVYLNNIESVPTGSKIYVISGSPNSSDHCVMRINTTGDRLYYPNGFYNYRGYCYRYDRTTLNGSGLYMENPSSPVFKYIKGEFNFFYNYSDHILESNFLTYTDDERLKFYTTYAQNGEDLLTTDITDFVEDFPIQDSSHSSMELVDGTITLTVDSDGTLTTYEITSVNSQTTTTKYKFITPYSYFDLLGFNVKIVNCSFTLAGSGQGIEPYSESYYISCEYYLKHTLDDIEKGENEYADDVDGDQTSQETKDALSYLVTFREGYGLDFDEFGDVEFPDYYTYADVYLYNNNAALNYILDDLIATPNEIAYVIQNIANDEDDVITQIGLFLDDSNYGQYYDVIVFDWVQESSSSYTHTFWYFETLSGRTKANVQFLSVMQDDLNKVKVNSAAIFTAVDNLENESLEFFNAKMEIDESILGWLQTVNNSINSLEFEPFDGSDILAMVTSVNGYCQDIASNTASGNTVLSSILSSIQNIETLMGNNFSGGYRQYMVWLDESIDDLELIETPKEFAGRMFNITKDVFYGLVAFNPFFEDIEDFVDMFYPIDRAGHSFTGKSLFFDWQNDYNPHSYSGV